MLGKSVIYLGLLSCFLVVIFDDFFSKTVKISYFVCDCMKTSSKYVVAFLLSIDGLKILLINAEKADGLMKIP